MKKKITVVLTSRGNYAKSKIINFDGTKQRFKLIGSVRWFFTCRKIWKNFKLFCRFETPVYYVPFILEGDTTNIMAKSTSLAINEFVNAFSLIKPQMVVVIGDRFESLGVAIAATYMNIKLVHVEGGERSGSIDEPIRHAITKLAHLHFSLFKRC